MRKTIVLLPGAGIGPEITAQAERILKQVASAYHHDFVFSTPPIGAADGEAVGSTLPETTIKACLRSDAVLAGAAGGPGNPETGLRRLRQALGLFANLRPAVRRPGPAKTPSGGARSAAGPIDLVIVREIFDGACFDRHGHPRGGSIRADAAPQAIGAADVRRVARLAFRLARTRRRNVVCIDAAGAPELAETWKTTMTETAAEHPDVSFRPMFADEAALRIVHAPREFDVIVTPNLFGDILSEMAGMAAGSPGLVPSASLGEGSRGLYEPVQRSAPDLAGRDAANPIPAILCAAMMLRHSFALEPEAEAVEKAVAAIRASNYRTEEAMDKGRTRIGTDGMGRLIAEAVGGA